jgi:hypothetical protein
VTLDDAARFTAPTLLVRGAWDAGCNEAGAVLPSPVMSVPRNAAMTGRALR